MSEDLRGISGLIFDLDGTLVESYSAHIKSWIRAAEFFGVHASEEDVQPHLGRSSRDIARALLGDRGGSDMEKTYRLKDETYYEIIPREVKPVEGALETLAGLKARGYQISIASSNPACIIDRSLKAAGLFHLADSIASQDEVERGKPEPDIFLLASKKLSLNPESCMGIGDTSFDVLAAKAARMRTAAYVGIVQTESELSKADPDYILTDLRELLRMFPELPSEG